MVRGGARGRPAAKAEPRQAFKAHTAVTMDGVAAPAQLRPVTPRAKAAVACFVLTCLLILASIWHDIAFLGLIQRVAGHQATQAEAAALDSAETWIARGYLLTLIVTAVVFCMWLHRSYSNLVRAGTAGLKYTARRAVEAFFIPFVNLVRPYRVVAETWGASSTLATGREVPPSERRADVHWLVGVWWISMLLGNGYGRVAAARLEGAKTLGDYQSYAYQSITAHVVTLIAAVSIIVIIRTITEWQERARESGGLGMAHPEAQLR